MQSPQEPQQALLPAKTLPKLNTIAYNNEEPQDVQLGACVFSVLC